MLTRRSLLSALSLTAIPFDGLAAPQPLDWFERRTVQRLEECCFEKPNGTPCFVIGEVPQEAPPNAIYCGPPVMMVVQGAQTIGVPPSEDRLLNRVIAPMSDWGGEQEVEKNLTRLVETAAPFLSGQIRSNIPIRTQPLEGADRSIRVTPPNRPPVTLVSRGPAGYLLVDAHNPNRMGALLFGHRIGVLA